MKKSPRRTRVSNWALALVSLCIAVLIALNIAYYVFYSREVTEAFEESTLRTVEQIALNLENQFVQMSNLTSYLALNSTINRALSIDPADQILDVQYEEMQQLRSLLRACSTVNQALSVHLYVDQEKLYAEEHEFFFSLSELTQDPAFADLGFQSRFMPYTVRSLAGETDYIVCARQIRSLSAVGRTIGAVMTLMEERRVWEMLRTFEDDQRSILLLSAEGQVLSCAEKSRIGTLQAEWAAWVDGAGEKVKLPSGGTLYARPVRGTGWYIVCRQADLPGVGLWKSPIVFIVLLSILMLVAMSIILNRLMARAVTRVNALSNVFRGEPVAELPVATMPIFRQLDEAMNQAAQLVQNEYEQMRIQMSMQQQLLQMQINPHFLYNSLDTILWLVRKGDIAQSEGMIGNMSRYLRLILNNGADVVPLRDEVDLMRAYVDMQRLGGKPLTLDVMMDADVGDLYVPKQTLQPIVENAILHGIRPDAKPAGRIDVLCYVEEEALYIVVTDNGVGIPKERLEEMKRGFAPTTAFGLHNVDQRIKLFSGGGEGYGITLASTPGQSTTVTLQIAVRRNVEMGNAPVGDGEEKGDPIS